LAEEHHPDFAAKLRPETRQRVRLLPYIPTDSMVRLFQNAAAILYPTLYEGLGFPALEAQAVGTPVLLSPVSSLRELAGPGARLLDPDDRRSWIELCGRLVAQYCGDVHRISMRVAGQGAFRGRRPRDDTSKFIKPRRRNGRVRQASGARKRSHCFGGLSAVARLRRVSTAIAPAHQWPGSRSIFYFPSSSC
jgi:hypothetical protein